MNKVKFYLERHKFYIVIGIICILLLGIFIFIIFNKEEKIIEEEIVTLKKEEPKVEINTIKVDVKGYVEKEGVYELDSDSRVIDAINKAGGLKKNANTDYINLSKKLVDEMIIIIYSNDQVNKFKEEDKKIIYIEYECKCPDNINDTCITKNDIVNTNGMEGTKEETKENIKEETPKEEIKEERKEEKEDNLISINKATKGELMTLTGIGESKAEEIIKYREENGDFKKLEDIMNVSGIGEKAYSKIKEYIKL